MTDRPPAGVPGTERRSEMIPDCRNTRAAATRKPGAAGAGPERRFRLGERQLCSSSGFFRLVTLSSLRPALLRPGTTAVGLCCADTTRQGCQPFSRGLSRSDYPRIQSHAIRTPQGGASTDGLHADGCHWRFYPPVPRVSCRSISMATSPLPFALAGKQPSGTRYAPIPVAHGAATPFGVDSTSSIRPGVSRLRRETPG